MTMTEQSQPKTMNPEARVGRRAEQKRRWDRENRLKCSCGQPRRRRSTHCQRCENEQRRCARDARYRVIAAMWNDGASMKEIGAAVGMTVGTVGFHLDVMRKEGWSVPHRHRYPPRS